MQNDLIVIRDGSFSEEEVKANIVCDEFDKIKIITIDLENIEDAGSVIASLSGAAVCLTGPGAFSFERSQIFHFLSRNKQLYPYLPQHLKSYKIGKWTWVSPEVQLDSTAQIGSMVFVGSNTLISAKAKIGNFSWIGEFVQIGVGAQIQKHTTIHQNVRIGAMCNILSYTELRKDVFENKNEGCTIDSDVFNVRATIVNLALKNEAITT